MRSHLLFLASVVLGIGSASCSFGLDFSGNTKGEEGELEFSYGSRALFDCLFGCPIDGPILAGANAHVVVVGGRVDEHFRATTSNKSIATVTYDESYSCVGSTASQDGSPAPVTRQVNDDESCTSHEKRRVTRIATVETKRSGAFDLRILDDSGDLIDRVHLEAHEASRVDLFANDGSAPISTAVPVTHGGSVDLDAKIFDAEGEPLLTDGGGFTWTVSDPLVARVGIDLGDVIQDAFAFDATRTTLEGVAPGSTDITFSTQTTTSIIEAKVTGNP